MAAALIRMVIGVTAAVVHIAAALAASEVAVTAGSTARVRSSCEIAEALDAGDDAKQNDGAQLAHRGPVRRSVEC